MAPPILIPGRPALCVPCICTCSYSLLRIECHISAVVSISTPLSFLSHTCIHNLDVIGYMCSKQPYASVFMSLLTVFVVHFHLFRAVWTDYMHYETQPTCQEQWPRPSAPPTSAWTTQDGPRRWMIRDWT